MTSLFHQCIAASLCGGQTAYPVLSKIEEDLERCSGAGAAAGVLNRSKPALYTRLSERFAPAITQALTLKILNICLACYHLRVRSTALLSRPFGLVVDPSNMCQLACPGCVHSARSEELKLFDWHKGTLSEDRLSALLKLYGPYAIQVYFCNYGEPLLNLATPKLIRMAKSYLMTASLSTSLSVQWFDALAYVESGLDCMMLSIDGATQPVYERFRRNGNLELVFSNIRKLVAARSSLGRHTPLLSWNFLAFEHNAHEIPLAAGMARKLGVDRFRVANPFDVRWDDPAIRSATAKPRVHRLDWRFHAMFYERGAPFPERVEADAIARAFETQWDEQAASGGPAATGRTCRWLYKNMVMDATGRIMPCCASPRPDANLEFAAFDGSAGDPFNSPKYRQARTTVNIGGPEIRRYFRAADPTFFDSRSLRILSGW